MDQNLHPFDTPSASLAGPVTATAGLGTRLRTLRRERRITLQEASRLTGVSTSTLSKIEREELSPTLSTTQRIAAGFAVELVSLLSGMAGAAGVLSGRRSVSRAGEGSRHLSETCVNTLLCADFKNKRGTPILTLVEARDPGDYSAWAKSDAEIFLYVLEGTVVVHSKLYESLELGMGDSIYYDGTTEHCWTTSGPDTAKVLWMLMGGPAT